MRIYLLVAAMLFWGLDPVLAEPDDYKLKVEVVQQSDVFQTQASFYLPLQLCQAYLFVTDYDAALNIPGVISSKSTRLTAQKVRVERLLQEKILFFPINIQMVLEFNELPNQGTDFVQVSGEAKSYKGSWRLESDKQGTWFSYRAESEPDSIWPKAVVEYFIKNRLKSSFSAFAKAGAARQNLDCKPR